MSQTLITQYFAAFGNKEWNHVAECFHDQISLQDSLGASCQGKTRVIDFCKKTLETVTLRLDLLRVYQASDSHWAGEFHLEITDPTGTITILQGVDLFTMKQGLIASIRAFVEIIGTEKRFGGNRVRTLNPEILGKYDFAKNPYVYFHYAANPREVWNFDSLESFSLYLLRVPEGSQVTWENSSTLLKQGDVLQCEKTSISLQVHGAGVRWLVAGTISPSTLPSGISHIPHSKIYQVKKPWGHELWISGEHPNYAFKQIRIVAGTKTSLQYHRQKQETNVLFEGTARLHYKSNPEVENESITRTALDSVEIIPIQAIDVTPPTLHRLEAMTDVLLYETSTPHLDDVIRVQDDSQRPDGRINLEHST